jgi:hypothetical protein
VQPTAPDPLISKSGSNPKKRATPSPRLGSGENRAPVASVLLKLSIQESAMRLRPSREMQQSKLWKYFMVTGVSLIALLLAFADYMELVKAGKVPSPVPEALQEALRGVGIFGGGAILAGFWTLVGLAVACAALAPILFAVRSNDTLTIIVSIVLVVVTWAAAVFSRTVIDLAVASVIT